MNKIRVGFLSSHNYFDKNSWSGILYYMYWALRSTSIEVVDLGNPYKTNFWTKILKRISPKKSVYRVGSDEYVRDSTQFANLVKEQLKDSKCDAIFSPVGSKELYFLDTNIPILYLSGMTHKVYKQTYSLNFTPQELDFLARQESAAISKATKLVYPSDWPVNSAIVDYQAEPDKIRVVPYGANLDSTPSIEDILEAKTNTSYCRLIFIGKDWERKGGEIAFQTLLALRRMKVNAELIIVGTKPPTEVQHEKLTVIPYLNKNKRSQMLKFYNLLLGSHFMIFPTKAEAFGVVSCEANAFGLPVITTEVGGIPTIIRNGKNGYMLPLSASANQFADLIKEIFNDKSRYQMLVCSSKEEYKSRLNWNKWAESIQEIIAEMI